MKLISAELYNVGVHHHVKVDFKDGLIALMGPQGSGKTTFVNAIYAGITNDFGRLSGTKQDAICQQMGELSSATAGITLELQFPGLMARIFRGLYPETSNVLELSDGRHLDKDKEVKLVMAELLGANRALLDNYVFVNQWSVRDLFQSQQTQRSEALSHLTGTKFIESRYSAVNSRRDTDIELLATGIEDTDRLRRELDEYQNLLLDGKKNIEALQATLLDSRETAKLKMAVNSYTETQKVRENLPWLEEASKASYKAHQGVIDVERKVSEQLRKLEEECAEAKAKMDYAEQEARLYKVQTDQWREKVGLTKALDKIREDFKAPPPECKVKETYEELEEQMRELDEKMSPYKAIIAQFEKFPDSDLCPTCGQSLEHFQASLEEARKLIEPLQASRHQIYTLRLKRGKENEAMQTYVNHRESLGAEEKRLAKRLVEMRDVKQPPPSEIGSVTELQLTYNTKASAVATSRSIHRTLLTDRSRAESEYFVAEKNRQDAVEKLAGDQASEEECNGAKELLDKDHKNQLEMAGLKARFEEHQRMVNTRLSAIEKAEKLRSQVEGAKEWIDLLGRASPVLHRNGIPLDVHSRAMRKLESTINATLKDFECPFRVSTGDDLSYVARFNNNTTMPAHRLSGGQQVILSLAMRWALNSLFAKQIGLLVLDEPTAGLDERHLGLLQSVLTQLGSAARNRGCQVIIITHEQRLRGVFDQVIELERPVL
jgi:DNA repair exonuclease SbcCD ATPase subunit